MTRLGPMRCRFCVLHILGCEESFACNTGWTHPYLHLHSVTSLARGKPRVLPQRSPAVTGRDQSTSYPSSPSKIYCPWLRSITPTKVSPALSVMTLFCLRTDCGLPRCVPSVYTHREKRTTAGNATTHELSNASALLGGLRVSSHLAHGATDDYEETAHVSLCRPFSQAGGL